MVLEFDMPYYCQKTCKICSSIVVADFFDLTYFLYYKMPKQLTNNFQFQRILGVKISMIEARIDPLMVLL
jgi:hypothetical protein